MLENEPNAPAEPAVKVEPASTEAINPNANAPAEVKENPEPKAESENESPAEPEGEKEGDEGTKKPTRAQQRISEIYAQKKEAEARAAAAWAEVARVKKEMQQIAERKADPNLSYEEQDALRVREAVKGERFQDAVASAQVHEQMAVRAMQETFAAKVEAARERMPDFDQVFTDATPISRIGAEFVANSDKAADIAYHLGKNPREAARIASLPDWQQGVELARIEAKVSAPPVRKISQAPKPVATLSGGSAPTVKDPANMSASEYMEWRQAQWRKGSS